MKTLPRLCFAHLPTPIESLPRLSAALNSQRLWVKRDDQTGLAFGGNKTRKLEFLVAEAQAHGARTLITAGATQSNHCRQTAAAAARFGFDCLLVLSGERPAKISGNLLLDYLFGAKVVWTTSERRQEALQAAFEQAWQAGQRPYQIPVGGSNPTGAAGYAYAMQELLQQCAPTDLPDWIVFASSSGGTHAGIVAGARLFGFPGKILGISNDETASNLSAHVASLASQTLDLLGEPHQIQPEDILVNDSFLGAGYGVMGEPEANAIKLFASLEGLLLDPVYTGRAAAGLIELCKSGYFKPDEKILFWHTGGTTALFADQYSPDHFNLSSS
jgi:D-cysteine desulfhydrase family pyridoxal phosphate-dependent enzyme